MLADKLNMAPAEAEKWVVNMIRLAHLDAKIDSKLTWLKKSSTHPSSTQIYNLDQI